MARAKIGIVGIILAIIGGLALSGAPFDSPLRDFYMVLMGIGILFVLGVLVVNRLEGRS